jgi:hypothetical protein
VGVRVRVRVVLLLSVRLCVTAIVVVAVFLFFLFCLRVLCVLCSRASGLPRVHTCYVSMWGVFALLSWLFGSLCFLGRKDQKGVLHFLC